MNTQFLGLIMLLASFQVATGKPVVDTYTEPDGTVGEMTIRTPPPPRPVSSIPDELKGNPDAEQAFLNKQKQIQSLQTTGKTVILPCCVFHTENPDEFYAVDEQGKTDKLHTAEQIKLYRWVNEELQVTQFTAANGVCRVAKDKKEIKINAVRNYHRLPEKTLMITAGVQDKKIHITSVQYVTDKQTMNTAEHTTYIQQQWQFLLDNVCK